MFAQLQPLELRWMKMEKNVSQIIREYRTEIYTFVSSTLNRFLRILMLTYRIMHVYMDMILYYFIIFDFM